MLLHGCRNFPLDFVPLQKKLRCFQTISFCVAMLKLTLFIVFYKIWNNQNQPETHQEPTKNQSEPTWDPPELRNFGWFLLGSWSVLGGFWLVPGEFWWVLFVSRCIIYDLFQTKLKTALSQIGAAPVIENRGNIFYYNEDLRQRFITHWCITEWSTRACYEKIFFFHVFRQINNWFSKLSVEVD